MNRARTSAKSRPSASAAASRRAEMRRIEAMSVEERIRTALGMRRRLAKLKPAPIAA